MDGGPYEAHDGPAGAGHDGARDDHARDDLDPVDAYAGDLDEGDLDEGDLDGDDLDGDDLDGGSDYQDEAFVGDDPALDGENSTTQPLPMVRREGFGDPPAVRAVARRVPSALPALGPGTAADAPPSSRATADRRRQARESPDGPAGASPPSSSAGEPVAGPPAADPLHWPGALAIDEADQPRSGFAAIPSPREPVSGAPVNAVALDEVLAPADLGAPAESAAVDVLPETTPLPETAPLPETTPLPETAPLDVPPPDGAPLDVPPPGDPFLDAPRLEATAVEVDVVEAEAVQVDGVAVAGRAGAHGIAVARGGEVGAPPFMGQPRATKDEVLDAEIVDDPAPAGMSLSATAADVVSALTEVAFRAARADAWIMSDTEPAGPAPATGVELVRRGPQILDADSWDTDTLPAVEQDSYQGRRRRASSARLWLVVGLVVAALSAAIAMPFLLMSGEPQPTAVPTPGESTDDGDISGMSASAEPTPTGPVGLPIGASPLVTTSATASESPSASPSPSGPFTVALQAEAGGTATSWGGTAGTFAFAGATVVDRIGDSDNWPGGPNQDGTLRFSGIVVPTTGTYQLKIYYVYTSQPTEGNAPTNRPLSLSVNGGGGATKVLNRVTTVTETVWGTITLQAGTSGNRIDLYNSSDPCPAIDQIVITKA